METGESFPALGESITLTRKSSGALTATFEGFGYGQVLFGSAAGGPAGAAPFKRLVSMSRSGDHEIAATRLLALESSGDLPSATALQVVVERDTMIFALDELAQVEIPSVRRGAERGFIIGLLVIPIAVLGGLWAIGHALSHPH